ncbi:MAG: hypothetical protein EOO88_38060 [Pedobacter sp.]|nr:MAG: hypothetical protein EOO88_38060 [Pedobacter sp.]
MRLVIIFILLAVNVHSGCKLFRTQTKTERYAVASDSSGSAQSLTKLHQRVKSDNSLKLITDSGSDRYQIKLYPKGAFSYSLQSGFNGGADSIVLSGNTIKLRSAFESSDTRFADLALSEARQESSAKQELQTHQQTSESNPSWKLLLLLSVPLLLIGFLIYKFLIKRLKQSIVKKLSDWPFRKSCINW